MVNLFAKFNYEYLLTCLFTSKLLQVNSVTLQSQKSFFSGFSFRTTVFIGMVLYKTISLQMFLKSRCIQQYFP